MSQSPRSSSWQAALRAEREDAHAASTTKFDPEASRRLAILPDTTLASIPGKESVVRGGRAASSSSGRLPVYIGSPVLRAIPAERSLPDSAPKIMLVMASTDPGVRPASIRALFVASRERSWTGSMLARARGGMPYETGSKGVAGRNAPLVESV